MTTLEKKQKLPERGHQMPDQYVDYLNKVLDTTLEDEQQRKALFEQLLAETSPKYQAVWQALA